MHSACILSLDQLVLSFLYVDNEGTRFSLMQGSSENPTVDAMVKRMGWLARVSSYSNLADAPSRGDDIVGRSWLLKCFLCSFKMLAVALKEKMAQSQ